MQLGIAGAEAEGCTDVGAGWAMATPVEDRSRNSGAESRENPGRAHVLLLGNDSPKPRDRA